MMTQLPRSKRRSQYWQRRIDRSDPAEQQQDEQDHDDEPKPPAAVVTGAVEWTAANAGKAAEQRNDENDKNDCTDRHELSPPASSLRLSLDLHRATCGTHESSAWCVAI